VSRAPGALALIAMVFFAIGFLAGDRPDLAPVPEKAVEQIALLRSELEFSRAALTTARQAHLTSWMTVATKELGEEAVPAPENNLRVLQYLGAIQSVENVQGDGIEWASAFVEWCLNQVGITGPKDLVATSWLTFGRKVTDPTFGAIVVFAFGHVGFVVQEDGDHLRVLGGNQSHAVTVKLYPKADVVGYRMPEEPGSKPFWSAE